MSNEDEILNEQTEILKYRNYHSCAIGAYSRAHELFRFRWGKNSCGNQFNFLYDYNEMFNHIKEGDFIQYSYEEGRGRHTYLMSIYGMVTF